jgi:hypothetical protein
MQKKARLLLYSSVLANTAFIVGFLFSWVYPIPEEVLYKYIPSFGTLVVGGIINALAILSILLLALAILRRSN